ncbi:MAG: SIR2 family protein [Fimbriimonadaceae bacterium]|nr:SIR2 family protein [Fimbriimonadaceae bacterium]
MREIAKDIGLDVDQEVDLLSVAQFHENQQGNRGKLNQILLDEFTKNVAATENHGLIAQLPVDSIWTTNYDTLIEDALRKAGRRPQVIHNQAQMSNRVRGSDVVVLKMHGDISRPDEAVLTRDDYESYSKTRQLFTERLEGELLTKTFLFLGFSFTDPNIEYVLSRIRVLIGQNVRTHFYVTRRPILPVNPSPEDQARHDYEVCRLELRMHDLKRYGIQTVLVDDYAEVTELLATLNKAAHARDVFVSGSAHEYGVFGRDKAEELCRILGRRLISDGFNLVNGFGLGIGSFVSMSAMETVYTTEGEQLEQRVLLRPFPQDVPQTLTRAQVWSRYRADMIGQSGHAVFIAGNKLDQATGNVVDANGVREEFEIAKNLGKTLIPIGATGFVAKILWSEMSGDLATFFTSDVSREFAVIGDESAELIDIVTAVLAIINKEKR